MHGNTSHLVKNCCPKSGKHPLATLALLPGASGRPRVQQLYRGDTWHTQPLQAPGPVLPCCFGAQASPVAKYLTITSVYHYNTPAEPCTHLVLGKRLVSIFRLGPGDGLGDWICPGAASQGLAHRVQGALQHHRAEEATPGRGGLRVTGPQQGDHPVAIYGAVSFAVEGVAGS